jgi:eukaryotic-like serine/threonine-protein kinase
VTDEIDFYSLEPQHKRMFLELFVNRGKCVSVTGGMCAEIYIFDQGEDVYPRYVCAKVPRHLRGCTSTESAYRFVAEMEKQLLFYQHVFVHWAFEFEEIMRIPVALFNYWGSDLAKLMREVKSSNIEKLSIMTYICEGLKHCQDRGLISHQDLKPENIFLRDIKPVFSGLPDLDIYKIPKIADFGLSNASIDSGIYDGSRPYMAPEQWRKNALSPATDIFALGVILYQFLTNGYHPVGIKLHEYWPNPAEGNSKKWTKPDAWKKWACGSAEIVDIKCDVSPELMRLIKTMLLPIASERPDISNVKRVLLNEIRQLDLESYANIDLLTQHFNRQVSNESLDVAWPYLFKRWTWFKSKFGKNT